MTGIINFETYVLSAILLNVTPGNDTIFVLSRSISQGKTAGIMSVLGIATGILIHTTMAALGLSIIVAKSDLLFAIIRYAGAAYLLYIGYRMLRNRRSFATDDPTQRKSLSLSKVYLDGVITNILNPKMALFFLAFLPQFINPASTNTFLSFLTLGVTFTITGSIWCLILVSFASAISAKLKRSVKLSSSINKACGFVLIGLGVKVALTGSK
ncbi:LysE family translocator [Spirosoma validum]|uniref:LysE family translocator n=1 Tax=Spirosoma validum TaxID=2771355 RepID=A0A927B4B0_9BACT|nr:LysE family translocator [Spirosoma validum]MBD2755376.1 LysE family translocator [Spirosoma validum]